MLELFHGPTLAFKDVAMQFLGRVMDHILAERGLKATIVGATSGDTGSAAIEAFRGRDTTDIFILHPQGRTSPVQRLQMTTVLDANVHNIALEGTFDDCQNIVKAMFDDHGFRDRVGCPASIRSTGAASSRRSSITSPPPCRWARRSRTGQLHRAHRQFRRHLCRLLRQGDGPADRALIIATNANDILRRTMDTGRYEMDGVAPTISPSMDIQISSNFERLLFESAGRDAGAVVRMMDGLKQSGGFALPERRSRRSGAILLPARPARQKREPPLSMTYQAAGYLLDPHTAVGVNVARQQAHRPYADDHAGNGASGKVPGRRQRCGGHRARPAQWLADLIRSRRALSVIANEQQAVEDSITARTRAA